MKFYSVGIVSGFFDPLHIGHIKYLKEAKENCSVLYVIVNNTRQAIDKKGYEFMPFDSRIAIIESLKFIDYVKPSNSPNGTVCSDILEIYEEEGLRGISAAFFKGGDRIEGNVPEVSVCEGLGIDVIYGIGGTDKPESSSILVQRAMENLYV